MATTFNFHNAAKDYVEGGFDHPAYYIFSRKVTVDRPQKYPFAWTIAGVTVVCGVFWLTVISLASHLVN
ncbi:hypothetical protein [Asticcacaulis sp. 201]|uniref:hypothetical protein n=1 Tax=Asticcacaulis sp. 201 TaxID=3028787 RepID=UPI0029167E7B|nr:hypothetical protein [Asticcacaulis sp. 201]MDV6332385.1 hypothetical protein [Asticcacaulis sp. 201]